MMHQVSYQPISGDADSGKHVGEVPVQMMRPNCWSVFLRRCLTHCAFFMLCSSYLFVSSIPRMMALIDFPLSLMLFIFPIRRSATSVLEHFESDILHYNIRESGCDLLLLSLVRSLILFRCFAYRNQTRNRSLMVSRTVFVLSLTLLAIKLGFSSPRIHPLTITNIVLIVFQFFAFTLVRRRRIQAPRPSIGFADDYYSALGGEEYPNLGSRTLLETDSRFLEYEGLSIHYRLRRHPTSPYTICLLHGFAGGVFSWRQVWDDLSQSATVLAFDRPGFGLSSRPYGAEISSKATNPYSPRSSIDLTLHMLEHFQLENCVIVGHSTGASLAMMVAKEAPRRISSLCLISYTEMTTLPSFVRSMFMTRLGKSVIVQLVRSELGQVSLRRSWYNPQRIPKHIIDDYRLSIALPNWTEALSEMVNVAEPLQCIDSHATAVDIPVVIVQGCDDKLSSIAELQRLSRSLQGRYRILRLRECGHIPQQENPAALVDIIKNDILGRNLYI